MAVLSRNTGVQSGFTLLEVMVALCIFAVAAAGFIGAVSLTLRQEQALEIKTFALWVAENRLAELRASRAWPGVSAGEDTVSMAGRRWRVRISVEPTPRPDMRRATVSVSLASADPAPLLSLTGFLGEY